MKNINEEEFYRWVNIIKIKAQIEILDGVLDIEDTLNVKLTLESLKQQLKELEDESKID
jgi:hypothetical protein